MKTTFLKQRIDGKRVRNATSPLMLEITAKDVKHAARQDPGFCVAAGACRAHMADVADVRVHLSRVFILRKGSKIWDRYETPIGLKNEIIAFDRGGVFEPRTFELKVPQKFYHKPRGKNAPDATKEQKAASSRRLRKVRRHATVNVRPHANHAFGGASK